MIPFMVSCRIDGTYSKQKAKYVNDAGPKTKENNAKMKILEIEGYPHLALFARRKIIKGEEILYDYGGKNLPWRKKVFHLVRAKYGVED